MAASGATLDISVPALPATISRHPPPQIYPGPAPASAPRAERARQHLDSHPDTPAVLLLRDTLLDAAARGASMACYMKQAGRHRTCSTPL